MKSHLGTLRTAAVLAAIGAAAVGCSSGGSGSSSSSSGGSGGTSAAELLSASAKNAASIKSFTATVDLHGSGSGSTGATSVVGTLSEQRQPTQLIQITTKSAEAAGINAGAITVIETPSAIYTKIPSMSSLTGGKPYLMIPMSQAKGGVLGPLVNEAQSSDPLDATQLLGGATDVQKVGTATINGVSTTEVKGTVPISEALAKLPAALRSKVGQSFQQQGISQFQFQVWIDGQNNVRKSIYSYAGKASTVTSTTTITSINRPVTISIPPSSQVSQLPGGNSGLSGL